jgi:hypothetical protein
VSNEEGVDDVVAEVAMSGVVLTMKLAKFVDLERMECRDTQISCIAAKSLAEPLEACRPQEGLKWKAPKYSEILGGTIRRAPHREAFIPDIKSWVSRAGWHATRAHRPRKVTHLGCLTRFPRPQTYQDIARPSGLRHADLEEVVLVSRRPT